MLQQKLDFLLEKYSVEETAVLKGCDAVVIGGKEIPLLSHRNERRFIELKNIVNNGTLVGISVMRVARIVEQGSDLIDALKRELDLCQWILQRKIKSVTAMQNDNVLNVIATTDDGVVCTIEISATLKKGEAPIDKHEIISQRGIACDVVVDAQLKQDSIYVYGNENKKFTDVDFELYGLSIEDIAIVRCAFSVVQNKNFDEILADCEEIELLAKMAEKSVETEERVVR